MLRSGKVDDWNLYRRQNPNWIPCISTDRRWVDLSGATLLGVDFSNVSLRHAQLHLADLDRADLSGGDLTNCGLVDVTFRDANLRLANLTAAKLSGANFVRANLDNANLFLAELNQASLEGARMSYANLRGAKLEQANLSKAVLRHSDFTPPGGEGINCENGASLVEANLSWCDCSDVDFTGANLTGAILAGTVVRNANLDRAMFGSNILNYLDLSSARNLDKTRHSQLSSVGLDTLLMSAQCLPIEFLQECGVPNIVIDYIPSLNSAIEPFEFSSCFISYSHRDEEFANTLHSRMRKERMRVWYAPHNIQAGKKLHEQIDNAIRLHDRVILVLSPESMSSNWVEMEVRIARSRERRENRRILFPISITDFKNIKSWKLIDADEGRDLAAEIREYYISDFSNWQVQSDFEKVFKRMLSDLKTE